MYSAFSSAANSLSQLYTQAMHHQKLSFQAGERHALVRIFALSFDPDTLFGFSFWDFFYVLVDSCVVWPAKGMIFIIIVKLY